MWSPLQRWNRWRLNQDKANSMQHFGCLDECNLLKSRNSDAECSLRGAFRTTLRVALTELVKGIDEQSNVWVKKKWKLFLLLPRLLLHKPLPKKTLETRFLGCQHPQRNQDSPKVHETGDAGKQEMALSKGPVVLSLWFKWANCQPHGKHSTELLDAGWQLCVH